MLSEGGCVGCGLNRLVACLPLRQPHSSLSPGTGGRGEREEMAEERGIGEGRGGLVT